MKLNQRIFRNNRLVHLPRLLPADGETLVQLGQRVEPNDIVARAEVPQRYHIVKLEGQITSNGPAPLKNVGDTVEVGEALAEPKGRLPFLQRTAKAPAAGVVTQIGTDWLLIESEPQQIELAAGVHGFVVNLIPRRGIIIASSSAMIQGACGFGGEVHGELTLVVNSPEDDLTETMIDESMANTIILGGRTLSEAALQAAVDKKVSGIIVGGIEAELLDSELTSSICVVATEGFGKMPISQMISEMLTSLSGREIYLRGQTPSLTSAEQHQTGQETALILASIRQSNPANIPQPKQREIEVNDRVRIIRGQYFGAIGQVNAIPLQPPPTDLGLITSGAHVTINGGSHYIPWANLEILG